MELLFLPRVTSDVVFLFYGLCGYDNNKIIKKSVFYSLFNVLLYPHYPEKFRRTGNAVGLLVCIKEKVMLLSVVHTEE